MLENELMKFAALLVGYLALLVNAVYLWCEGWFLRNPGDDFMGGFVMLPALICWLLSIPTALAALVLAVVALVRRRSRVGSLHALVVSLVACALAVFAIFFYA